MILIIGYPDDEHIRGVKVHLDASGEQTYFLSTRDFGPSTLSLTSRSGRTALHLLDGAQTVPLDKIETVWLRRTPPPNYQGVFASEDDAAFARAETKCMLNSLWPALADRRWMNSYNARAAADYKPNQLKVATELGLAVPDTLITASPEAALAFCKEHKGDIIYKPLTPFFRKDNDKWYTIYTNRLNETMFRSKLAHVVQAPCLFQKYIPKKVELRTIVVGHQLFTISIDSQASSYSSVDWRRYDLNVAHKQYELPSAVATQIRSLMHALGLVFGCIDMIVTPDDSYVFLEVNEAGNWMWLDTLAGTDVTRAVADYLLGRTDSHI